MTNKTDKPKHPDCNNLNYLFSQFEELLREKKCWSKFAYVKPFACVNYVHELCIYRLDSDLYVDLTDVKFLGEGLLRSANLVVLIKNGIEFLQNCSDEVFKDNKVEHSKCDCTI